MWEFFIKLRSSAAFLILFLSRISHQISINRFLEFTSNCASKCFHAKTSWAYHTMQHLNSFEEYENLITKAGFSGLFSLFYSQIFCLNFFKSINMFLVLTWNCASNLLLLAKTSRTLHTKHVKFRGMRNLVTKLAFLFIFFSIVSKKTNPESQFSHINKDLCNLCEHVSV